MCVCVYQCLRVGLQSEQAAHLSGFTVNDPSSNKIGRVWIHPVQQSYTEAQQLKESMEEKVEIVKLDFVDYLIIKTFEPNVNAPNKLKMRT